MNSKWLHIACLIIAIFYGSGLRSQNFADKEYYLIDSLDLNSLKEAEKKLIDTSLVSFYKAKQDTVKAKIINSLVAYSANEKVWPKYNNWLINYTANKLKGSQLSSKERKLLINIQALTLNNEGYRLKGKSKLNDALKVYLKSLKVLEEIGDKDGQGNVLNNIGTVYKNLGNIPEALAYHQESLLLKKETKNKKGEAYTINNIAIIYRGIGDVNKALEYYLLSLNILEELEDVKGIAVVLNNVATIYSTQGNKLKAKEYFERSLKMHREVNNKRSIAITLNHLAGIYAKEDSDKSIVYYIESLGLNKEIGDKSGEATTLRSLGDFYIKKGELDKGYNLLKESLSIFRSINEVSGEVYCLNTLSEYYLNQNNSKEAKNSALKSLELAKKLGYPSDIKQAAKILSSVYEQEKNYSKAYKMQKLYVKMQDSIRSKAVSESVLKQQAKYAIEKKEQEIKVLSAQNDLLKKDKQLQKARIDKNRIAIVLISIALLLASVFILTNWKWNKKKKRIYKLLKNQKEEISLKNDEKTAMLQEIHHRVKNNLQTVNSLLRLQAKEIKDPEIVAKFKETQKRIITIASLHEKMYGTDNLKHIDVKEHLTTLAKDLVNTYAVEKDILLDIDIEPVTFGVKTLVPLGLIINEVVINSLKYAFEGKENGKISIHLKALGVQNFEMLISDNGIGLEEDSKKGLGTRLIKIFTKQLQGNVERMNHTGLGYKIVFQSIDDLNF